MDSSTLQLLNDYGGYIWENEPIPTSNKIYKMSKGFEAIEALRKIFFVNQRAMWQFALSENSFSEIKGRNDNNYLSYFYDVLDHCQICLAESGFDLINTNNKPFDEIYQRLSNNISKGDLDLLFDAKKLNCDAFLTCDFKLAKSYELIINHLDILLLTPMSLWFLIEPWARLYV